MTDRLDHNVGHSDTFPELRPRYRKGIAPTKVVAGRKGQLVDVISSENAVRWSMSVNDLHAALEQACQRGDIVDADDNPLPANTMLEPDDIIYLHREVADECEIEPLEVLWRNDAAMIVNKPGWISTIPRGSYIARSVVVAARRQFHNNHIIAAHRLDRLTSGCLLLVTDPRYRSAYQLLFQHGKVRKTYRALTELADDTGQSSHRACPGDSFSWKLMMYKPAGSLISHVGQSHGSSSERKSLHETVTEAQCLRYFQWQGRRLLEWQLRPVTGFTHQLRVALNHHGYPIISDPLYPQILPADDVKNLKPQMGLHSLQLEFTDPITSGKVSVQATKPSWWP